MGIETYESTDKFTLNTVYDVIMLSTAFCGVQDIFTSEEQAGKCRRAQTEIRTYLPRRKSFCGV